MLEDRRVTFCASLRAARERKGVSLEAIAESTKISRSLLKGLEQHDLSRWPQGLYRRAYLRDYLRAIELSEESIVTEFVRLFPDEQSPQNGRSLEAEAVPDGEETCTFSMLLAEDPGERFARIRGRLLAAAIDLAIVALISAAAWWTLQANPWTSSAIIAIAYYSIGTAAFGRSVGAYWLDDTSWRHVKPSLPPEASTDTFLERFRAARGLAQDPSHPSMTRRLASLALNAAFFRILFFR